MAGGRRSGRPAGVAPRHNETLEGIAAPTEGGQLVADLGETVDVISDVTANAIEDAEAAVEEVEG